VGQEIVKYKEKVVWSIVYYGGIIKDVLSKDAVYGYLRIFLSDSDDIPARGKDGQVKPNGNSKIIYHNRLRGGEDIKHFSGREFIMYDNDMIYELFYSGGIVE